MEDRMPLIENIEIIRVIHNQPKFLIDQVVKEVPYALNINGKILVSLICTPEFVEDLSIGYLFSQGLISSINEVDKVDISEENIINIKLNKYDKGNFINSIMSSGERSLNRLDETIESLRYDKAIGTVTPDTIYEFCNRLFKASTLHAATGGVHNAALFSFNKDFFEFRKDIGRHNAVDKLIGYCLSKEISLEDKILVFSGRISSEIIRKVAKAKIPMIISVSAPTDLSIKIAKGINITLVGFVRGKKMNIYNDCGHVALS
jgi:FdhD protein